MNYQLKRTVIQKEQRWSWGQANLKTPMQDSKLQNIPHTERSTQDPSCKLYKDYLSHYTLIPRIKAEDMNSTGYHKDVTIKEKHNRFNIIFLWNSSAFGVQQLWTYLSQEDSRQ